MLKKIVIGWLIYTLLFGVKNMISFLISRPFWHEDGYVVFHSEYTVTAFVFMMSVSFIFVGALTFSLFQKRSSSFN